MKPPHNQEGRDNRKWLHPCVLQMPLRIPGM
jgi:hypothetical protein